jgi:hypothetical protein
MTLLDRTAPETFTQRPIPVLKTARLILRAPRFEDAEAIVALVNDRRIAENTSRVPHPYGLADAQAFLTAANTDDDEIAFVTCSPAALASEASCQRGHSISALAPALQRLCALADACGNDRARFLDAVTLTTDAEFFDPRADRVSLLTLHAAKGLEFPVVFITGLEDGLLPLYWGDPDQAALEEERRLFYVGMTRAKDKLILSRAEQRHWRGALRRLEPSPFLRDIETELTKHQRMEPVRRKPQDRQLKLF